MPHFVLLPTCIRCSASRCNLLPDSFIPCHDARRSAWYGDHGLDSALPAYSLLLALVGLLALIQARVVSRVIPRHKQPLQAFILHWLIPIVSPGNLGAGSCETGNSGSESGWTGPSCKRTRAQQNLWGRHSVPSVTLAVTLTGVLAIMAATAGHAIAHAILYPGGRDRPPVSNLDR